ncbi:MAG: T9SS type A sorting domain-containing protein [Saprospiraceae bacterium]|nr:T9SS type A sorting domain-containing protein [Saprospiraceae bacterium]
MKRFRWYNDGQINTSAKMANTVDEKALIQETTTIQIFPNPSKNLLKIDGIELGETIEITDIQGKIIMSHVWNGQAIQTNLVPGLYFVKIRNVAHKFVITQ